MRNKFMSRGALMILFGIGIGAFGYFLKNDTDYMYGWAMIAGVVIFGVGFLTVLYSLIRKVEAQSILEDRAAEQELAEQDKDEKKAHGTCLVEFFEVNFNLFLWYHLSVLPFIIGQHQGRKQGKVKNKCH